MDKVAKVIRKKRIGAGAITFSRRESSFVLDDDNVPVSVSFTEQKCSNHLIEELMLMANQHVATFLYKNKIPAAFRVHDSPNIEKLQELSNLSKIFGHNFNTHGNITQVKESLNKLLSDIKGTPEENMISSLAIRTMAKAECDVVNIGHYGLGSSFMPPHAYGWVTAGIRRYADNINSRQLFGFIDRKKRV